VGLIHADHHDEAGERGQDGHRPDGGGQSQHVGHHAGEEGANCEAAVTPEAVDADRGGSPAGMGHVADGRQQRRIDHRRPRAEQDGADRPGATYGAVVVPPRPSVQVTNRPDRTDRISWVERHRAISARGT
jgi:hypothetical protein